MSIRARSRGRGHGLGSVGFGGNGNQLEVRKLTDLLAGGDSSDVRLATISVNRSSGGDGSEDTICRQLTDEFEQKCLIGRRELVKKPSKVGINGRPMEVISNHFGLTLGLKDQTFFHYDIDIRLISDSNGFIPMSGPSEKKMRKLMQKENLEVIEKLVREWPLVFADKPYVFDGLKNMYTKDRLDLKGRQQTKALEICLDGMNEQWFEVKIQFANEIEMSLINDFMAKRLNVIPDDAFHVLEVILRFKPTASLIPVGRSLYMKGQNLAVGDNALMAYGHYQSVHMTEVGPTLVIDRTATLFRTSGPLIDFLIGLMPKTGHRDISRIAFDADLVSRLSRQLSGIRVSTEHMGGKRHSFIDSLSFLRPKECEFELKRNGIKVRTNVFEYFKEQYNIEIQNPDIPCVKLRGSVARYLPIEVCRVVADQPILRKHITPAMTSSIVRKSGQQKPVERFEFIEKMAQKIGDKSEELLNQMGIKISTKPIRVMARVLEKPKCLGTDRRVVEPKNLNKWYLICMFSKLKDEMNTKVDHFVNRMIREGSAFGMTIAKPEKKYFDEWNPNTVENIFKNLSQISSLELTLFCIPYGDGTYHSIKFLADIKFGLMTQCIKVENLLDTPNGFLKNFLLKINGKLGGQNTIISTPERPPYMTGLMVIGADVTHPAPTDRTNSSVAAVIGSYDEDFTKFSASIRVQRKNKEEIITQFKQMIVELLNQYKNYNNNSLPTGLLLFRDGVSEGQFEHVLKYECQQMKEACDEVGVDINYKPNITFVVVQKRHHTRFLPALPSQGVGRAGNIPPGTVVDHTITNPSFYEYYLCSHFGLMGTSRPAKYVVLYDDHGFSFDQMELLSYYLCHTYIRTTKSISIPSPVMYSHLAAKRAKDHIIAQNRRSGFGSNAGPTEEVEEYEQRLAKNLNENIKVNETLKNLLYYC